MQIGDLFFNLGFKATGTGDAKAFQGSIEGANGAVALLSETMQKLLIVLDQLALKMSVATRPTTQSKPVLNEYEQAKADELASREREEKSFYKEQDRLLLEKDRARQKTVKTQEKQVKVKKDLHTEDKKNVTVNKEQKSLYGVLNQRLEDSVGKMNALRIKTLAVTSAVVYFVKKASDAARELNKMSSLSGFSQQSLQRMGDMAAQSGGDITDITGAIQNFQKQSIDIKLGRGGNLGAYNLLGLNPHDDPIKLLDQIGQKLKSMPAAYGANLARDLGLSDDLIYMLKEMADLPPPRQETLLTNAELKRLKDFNFYFNRIFEQGKRTLMKFGAAIAPFVSEIIYLMDRISYLSAKGLNAIEPYLKKMEPYMSTIKAVMLTLFAALFPTVAAFMLLAVVLEDIASFVNGEKSIFGALTDQLSSVEARAQFTITALRTLLSLMSFGTLSNDQIMEMTDKVERGLADTPEKLEQRLKMERLKGLGGLVNEPERTFPQWLTGALPSKSPSQAGGMSPIMNITVNGDMTDGTVPKLSQQVKNGTWTLGLGLEVQSKLGYSQRQ